MKPALLMLMACSNLAGVEGESLLASQTLRAQQRAKLQTFTAASVHITIDLLLDEEQQLLNNLRAKYDIGASGNFDTLFSFVYTPISCSKTYKFYTAKFRRSSP